MYKKSSRRNDAVTPVVGTVILISIMVFSAGVISSVGLQVIGEQKAKANADKVASEMELLNLLNENLAYGTPGATRTNKISFDDGSLVVGSKGDRIVPMYVKDIEDQDPYDFTISGFNNDDNSIKLKMNQGECDKAVVHWDISNIDIDEEEIDGYEAPEVETGSFYEIPGENPGVQLYGSVIDFGTEAITKAYFEYKHQDEYEWIEAGKNEVPPEGYPEDNLDSFSFILMGIDYEPYDYRAVVVDIGGKHYGQPETFDLSDTPVNNLPATVTTGSYYGDITFTGTLGDCGKYEGVELTEAEVCIAWGPTGRSSPSDYVADGGGWSGWLTENEESSFSRSFSIPCDYNGYYEAFAQTAVGMVEGGSRQFSTPNCDAGYTWPNIETIQIGANEITDIGNGFYEVEVKGRINNLGSEDDGINTYFLVIEPDGTTRESTSHLRTGLQEYSEDFIFNCVGSDEDVRTYTYSFRATCPNNNDHPISGGEKTFDLTRQDNGCIGIPPEVLTISGSWSRPHLYMTGWVDSLGDNPNGVYCWFSYDFYDLSGTIIHSEVSAPELETSTGTYSQVVDYYPGFHIVGDIYIRAHCEGSDYGSDDGARISIKGGLWGVTTQSVGNTDKTLEDDGEWTVTFNGNVWGEVDHNCDGNADSEYWFEWGETGTEDDFMVPNPAVCLNSQTFTATVHNLAANEDYVVAAYVKNSDNVVKHGATKPFPTGDGGSDPNCDSEPAPTVETGEAEFISDHSATLHGHVDCGGPLGMCLTQCAIQYRIKDSGDSYQQKIVQDGGDPNPTNCILYTHFWEVIDNLQPGTWYEYRAHAWHVGDSDCEDFGEPEFFETDGDPPGIPIVDTLSHSTPQATTCTVNADLVDNGGDNVECTLWFELIPNPPCFLAGTKIPMADGSYKNIEDVEIGDIVVSYDEEKSNIVNSEVSFVFKHNSEEMDEGYLIVNNILKVTPNHPLFINGRWIEARNLKIGDQLYNINTEKVLVTSIEKVSGQVPTYNLEINNYHTYFAENILVHNKQTIPPNGRWLATSPGGTRDSPGPFSRAFSGLAPETTYTYLAIAVNSEGESINTDYETFTTDEEGGGGNDCDGDGISDSVDNCYGYGSCCGCNDEINPSQIDSDGDGIGNACDDCKYDPYNDADGDGVCGNVDNCPNTYNPGQEDSDGDGEGDACDNDPPNQVPIVSTIKINGATLTHKHDIKSAQSKSFTGVFSDPDGDAIAGCQWYFRGIEHTVGSPSSNCQTSISWGAAWAGCLKYVKLRVRDIHMGQGEWGPWKSVQVCIRLLYGDCHPAGTMITMADGTLKDIKDIEVGDIVKSYSSSECGCTENIVVDAKVSKIHQYSEEEMASQGDYYIIINGKLRATIVHPVAVKTEEGFEWIDAGKLQIGDIIHNIAGDDIIITSIDKVFEPVPVYGLEIEDYENYFADGILVHNGLLDAGGTTDDRFTSSGGIIPPQVSTGEYYQETSRNVVLLGELRDLGSSGIVNVYLKYGLDGGTEYTTDVKSMTSTGTFYGRTAPLSSGTYYYIAVADGIEDLKKRFYVDDSLEFPVVITDDSVEEGTSATLNGHVTSEGLGSLSVGDPGFMWVKEDSSKPVGWIPDVDDYAVWDQSTVPDDIIDGDDLLYYFTEDNFKPGEDGTYHIRAFVTGTTPGASGSEEIDARNELGGGMGLTTVQRIAQTFTAESSLPLSKVQLSLKNIGAVGGYGVYGRVYFVDSNFEILAESDIYVTQNEFKWVDVQFKDDIDLVTGNTYGIVLEKTIKVYYSWENSNAEGAYPRGLMYYHEMTVEGGQWIPVEEDDFLFRVYVKSAGEGVPIPIIGYGEDKTVKISGSSNPDDTDDEGDYIPAETDQVIKFDTPIGPTESIDLFGYYAHEPNADSEYPEGDYDSNQDPYNNIGDENYPRRFASAETVGRKGLCIDLIDRIDTDGDTIEDTDTVFARVWMFDTGGVYFDQDLDYDVKSISGSVVKSTPSGGAYMEQYPDINIINDKIFIGILQMKSDGAKSIGGKGGVSCTIQTQLEEPNTIRDVVNAESFKMQVHGSSEDAWIRWLTSSSQGLKLREKDGTDKINELTFEKTSPYVSISQSIYTVEIIN